ncbi:MAG: DUF4493 domain-containing protein, partial [Bacteroidetes bacterium]|nr:DUF4493 domain-containing protein [Candidatus Cryptobacteroides faecigallinarum]
MRHIRFVLTCLAAFATVSCTEALEEIATGADGEITVSLTSDGDCRPHLKSAVQEEEVPAGEFIVEIFKTDGNVRLYRDTYANTENKAIKLNGGDYRLVASHGDPDRCGFDAPYYMGEEMFTVHAQTHEEVHVTAKLANVKVAVEFGEHLVLDYPEHYAVVRSDKDCSLEFSAGEERTGYMPAGNLSLELYAKIDGEWKYYASEPEEYSPNDFVTFHVDTKEGEGSLSLNIKVDDSVELVEKEVEIPQSMLPKEAPKMTFNGFGDSDVIEVVEAGETPESLKIDIVADAGIGHCILHINSEYLAGIRVPAEIDLVSVEENVAEILKDNGFDWRGIMQGQRLAYIDLTGVAEKLASEVYDDANPFKAEISFEIEDSNGKKSAESQSVTIAALKPEFSFSAVQTDAWARSIRGMEISYANLNPAVLKLQYKAAADGEWQDAGLSSDSGSVLSFNNISGLTPETEYQLRAIYNGNEAAAVQASLTTEAAAQVGNSGFEEWQTSVFEFTYNFFGKHEQNVDWYHPWSSEETDIWWAVNSRVAMPSSTSVASANWNWVRFPTVAYTADAADGGNAAVIYSVAVGDWTTNISPGTSHAGELFIGTADDSGNHSSEGHSFGSRPDRLEFMYKYDSNGGETFFVNAELYSEDGTVIATASTDSGSASSSWLKFSLPFQYTDTARKAARIYVSFKSTSASEPSVTGNKVITIADNAQYTGNFG